MAKEKNASENPGNKKNFLSRFRKSKQIVPPVLVEKKLPSAAKVATTPQISMQGLSYAAKHLMLLLQHHVDAQHIKVPSTKATWEMLVQLNPSVDLIEKKDRAKDICSIHHFSPQELQDVAKRVSKFVKAIQPHNILPPV